MSHNIFVTSRSFELPESSVVMTGSVWFNLWSRNLWPLKEIEEGDTLFWYETPSKKIVWQTELDHVEAWTYADLGDVLDEIEDTFGVEIDRDQDYLESNPPEGYCLAYAVNTLRRVDLPRPDGVRFNMLGWERGDDPRIASWLAPATIVT